MREITEGETRRNSKLESSHLRGESWCAEGYRT
jgi:hypothetical protein